MLLPVYTSLGNTGIQARGWGLSGAGVGWGGLGWKGSKSPRLFKMIRSEETLCSIYYTLGTIFRSWHVLIHLIFTVIIPILQMRWKQRSAYVAIEQQLNQSKETATIGIYSEFKTCSFRLPLSGFYLQICFQSLRLSRTFSSKTILTPFSVQVALRIVHLSQNSKTFVQTTGIKLDNWPIGIHVAEQMDY